MRRIPLDPRRDWQKKVEAGGLIYHTPNGQPYWDESACYLFSAAEVDMLEAATEELHRLCLEAGQYIIDHDRFESLGIPYEARGAIIAAWNAEPPSLYGRFDLMYDGQSPPKLLEYNANTPTSLLEASVIQWQWLQDVRPKADQFNSLHEKLIAKWKDLKPYLKSSHPLHFTCMKDNEDWMTVTYLRDTAEQAGIRTEHLAVRDLGWNSIDHSFKDLKNQTIHSLFALYPWEWLLKDFGNEILRCQQAMDWIEPIWKMMWSNKGLLAILWEMFPGHPNLLPAFLDGPRDMPEYARKPLLSREGANVTLHTQRGDFSTPGPYSGPFVYQKLASAPVFNGQTPVIGSWYIMDQGPAGMGIREAEGITNNLSRFVPHLFE